jgi:hypothetical protein
MLIPIWLEGKAMAVREAKELFYQHNPYPGKALENHNIRIGHFAAALAHRAGLGLDSDLLWTGCYLHDFGLLVNGTKVGLPELDSEPLYLRRSWLAVRGLVETWGLSGSQQEELRDILLYNHGFLPQRRIAPIAELVRKAVHVEHSRGFIRNGLSRAFCKGIFRDHPRLDLTPILLDFARIAVLEDGPAQLLPMFFPGPSISRD